MSGTTGVVGQSANSVDSAQQADGEKPGPRQNEYKNEWVRALWNKCISSKEQWSNAEDIFKRPVPAAGDEDEESKNQRRLAYHRKIEKVAQDLLRATDAAVDAYAPQGGLTGRPNAPILRIRETLGDKYMECEKYDKAEEQYNMALRGWSKEIDSSEGGEMRNKQVQRLLSCRRSVAVAICRGARTKTEPQKTRLEALKLIMENINGEKHGNLKLDVRCCDDIAFRLIEGTYPPPGSDEDSYDVCLEHVATLKKASAQLETSNEEAKPKLRVFILRMRVRILELLEEDLGDLDGATIMYDALKKIEPQSYMEQLDDGALKDLVNRLMGYVRKFGDRDEKRRETRRRWRTALQVATTAPAPGPSVRDTEDEIQGDSGPPSLRKTTTGLSTATEVSDTGKGENDAEDDDDGDSFHDGVHGEVMEANHQKNPKHWHEKWIKNMKDFSEITLRHAPAIGPNLAVRLTVIDTGIHAAHPRFEDIKDWSRRFKDFSKIEPPEVRDNKREENSEPQIHATQGSVGDKPVDEDGHGTFIAGLLLDLVPGLDLYIARIGTTRDQIANDRHIAYKMGKAVDHAVTEWETEIISISVGCNSTDDVRNPIRKAIYKNVVVLAASGNSGNSRTPLYPATEDKVYKIYSASTLANPSPISGTATDLKFSFYTLGEDIQSIWPGQLVHKLGRDVVFRCGTKEKEERKRLREEKRKAANGISIDGKQQVVEHECSEKCKTSIVASGTSFAAPIAAAIVAIIYQFYNTYKFQIDSHLRPGCEGLKSIESIRHILTRMGGPRRAADGSLGIVFLQAPSYRTGSDFHFEPFDSPRGDSAIPRKFQLKEDDKDEWGDTYDEFFWRQLVRVINAARRHGGIY